MMSFGKSSHLFYDSLLVNQSYEELLKLEG